MSKNNEVPSTDRKEFYGLMYSIDGDINYAEYPALSALLARASK